MTTEEQINKLENRIKDIETSLEKQLDIMASMNEELKKITRGIYGDKENQTKGLIERQLDDEKKLLELEKRVGDLESKVIKEYTEIKDDTKVEKIRKNTIIEVLKKIKEYGVAILILMLVIKDIAGIDNLLQLLFK